MDWGDVWCDNNPIFSAQVSKKHKNSLFNLIDQPKVTLVHFPKSLLFYGVVYNADSC